MSIPEPAALYTIANGARFENIEIPVYQTRVPTTSDINYPLGKRWINISADGVYDLTSFTSTAGTTTATWTFLGQAAGALNTLETDDLATVTPVAGNIVLAGGTGIATTGAGATATISLDVPVTVPDGGTGVITLTDHGVLLGSGVGAITPLAAATTGTGLMGVTGADPAFTASPSYSGTITAGTGLVATTGGVTATAGGASITGTTTINTAGNANTTIGNAAGAGAVTINVPSGNLSVTGNGNTLGIGNDAAANTIDIGSTSATALNLETGTSFVLNGVAGTTYNIGAACTTGAITIGGTGQTTGALTVGSSTATSVVNVGTGTGATTVNIATGITNAKTINIGSGAAMANTIHIGGTGANVITLGNTQTAGSIAMGTAMTSGTISIGGTGLNVGTMSIAPGTGAQEVDIANAAGNKTVNIAAGGGVNAIAIGSSAGASSLALSSGSAGITMTGNTSLAGNLSLTAAGNKLNIHASTAASDSVGTATLVGGTIGVACTAVTANSKIFLSRGNPYAGTPGFLYANPADIVPSTSFVINSTNVGDVSDVNYVIIN